MTEQDFLHHQFLTLREEIRESKARIFKLLVLGALFVPAAGYAADAFPGAFASASLPLILLVFMLDVIAEQNAIIRAGRFLREHVEPRVTEATGWERWLESNHRLRDADRYFFGSFMLLFFVFYGVASAAALGSLSKMWPDPNGRNFTLSALAYGLGGLWVLFVLLRHWHACTTTK